MARFEASEAGPSISVRLNWIALIMRLFISSYFSHADNPLQGFRPTVERCSATVLNPQSAGCRSASPPCSSSMAGTRSSFGSPSAASASVLFSPADRSTCGSGLF